MSQVEQGPPRIGLDIGGANLKASHSDGSAVVVPFELWKRPSELPSMLAKVRRMLPDAGVVGLTMTAELCDCYVTKAEGVHAVLQGVSVAFEGAEVRVWGLDGRFHGTSEIVGRPDLAAAANWHALATRLGRELGSEPGLLIDIGSTTADLIPIRDGRPAVGARTDTGRLQGGTLVYAGVRRTPIMALATALPHRGIMTGLTAELFGSTLDVYLTLGLVPEDPNDRSTADGRPATVEAARDRLARMVGADRSSFDAEDARELARAADEALMSRLIEASHRACDATIGRPRTAIVAGSGAFLARRLAERIVEPGGPIVELEGLWGPSRSRAACAAAMVDLMVGDGLEETTADG